MSFAVLVLALGNTTNTSATETEEHLGHDYPRQVVRNRAETSSKAVEEKYTELLQHIRSGITSGDEHMSETASQLKAAQKSWLRYREDHCELTAYVYVYPAGSRMFASQYHSCVASMNDKRLQFFKNIAYEFQH